MSDMFGRMQTQEDHGKSMLNCRCMVSIYELMDPYFGDVESVKSLGMLGFHDTNYQQNGSKVQGLFL